MVFMTANRFQAPQTSTFNYTFLLPNSDTVTGTCVFSNYAHVIGPIQKKKNKHGRSCICDGGFQDFLLHANF